MKNLLFRKNTDTFIIVKNYLFLTAKYLLSIDNNLW